MNYPQLVEWLGDSVKFEKYLIEQTLKFSMEKYEIVIKEILQNYIGRLTTHPHGPYHMLEHRLYDQLE